MSAVAQRSPAASPARLAQKAAELVEQCHYDLACQFLTRALEQAPGDAALLDALADVYLMLGNAEAAAMLLEKSARVAPDTGAAMPPGCRGGALATTYSEQLPPHRLAEHFRHVRGAVRTGRHQPGAAHVPHVGHRVVSREAGVVRVPRGYCPRCTPPPRSVGRQRPT